MSTSKSSPTNTTSTSTSLTTKNLNVSGNQGITAVGGENGTTAFTYSPTTDTTAIDASSHTSVVNTTTTDFGAISAGTGLASAALDTVRSANRTAIAASQASEDRISSFAGNALTAVQHNEDNTVSVISGLASQFGTALQTNFQNTQSQLGNVVSALNATYTANNTSANQQVINAVTESGQQSADVIKYVAIAASVAVVAFLLFKR